jgi:hypothetical protein
MPKPPPPPPPDEQRRTSTRDKVVFLVILVVVILLAIQLFRSVRKPSTWTPTPPVAREPGPAVNPESPPQWDHAAPPQFKADEDEVPASQRVVPPPPVPKHMANLALKLVDGGWVVDRPSGPRNWIDFQVTPPSYFVSDDERQRFRDYWMKEAYVRVNIYCDVTKVCPPEGDVDRMLASLFDDAYASGPETPEQYQDRRGRWRQSMWDWRSKFGTAPQSVFSLAGLEQFRGPDQPKPPLESDSSPDGGAR